MRGDVLGKCAGRGLAARRQLRGELPVDLQRLGLLFLERVEIVVGAVEFGQSSRAAAARAGQLVAGHAMLAATIFDRGEAASTSSWRAGSMSRGFEVARQLARGFADLDGGLVDHRHDLGEPRSTLDSVLIPASAREAVACALALRRSRSSSPPPPARPSASRPRFECACVLRELRHFAFLEVERLQFADLVAQQLDARFAIARLAFELEARFTSAIQILCASRTAASSRACRNRRAVRAARCRESDWNSCWPWMSTISAPTSRNNVSGTDRH